MQSSITKSSFLFMYLHLYFPFLIEFGVKKTHVKGIGTASLLWHTRPWKGLLLLSLSHLPFATLFLPCLGFPCGSAGKEYACNVGDLGSIPGLGRSPGEGNSLQYSCLENSMDCIVHGVAKSWTRLSDFYFHSSIWLPFQFLFSSVTQKCPTLYDPMDCSTPGLPLHH